MSRETCWWWRSYQVGVSITLGVILEPSISLLPYNPFVKPVYLGTISRIQPLLATFLVQAFIVSGLHCWNSLWEIDLSMLLLIDIWVNSNFIMKQSYNDYSCTGLFVDLCFHWWGWGRGVNTQEGITGSKVMCIFNLMRKCQIAFQCSFTVSISHQQCVSDSIALCFFWHLVFLLLVIQMDV